MRPSTTEPLIAGIPAPIYGYVMKEAVRRAMIAIHKKRFTAEFIQKGVRPSGRPDYVSDADLEAQAIYVDILTECFPGFGIVGEEIALRIPCTLEGPKQYSFYVDPLDGTYALFRKQSHGIGTQMALEEVDEDGSSRIIGAYVGNVLTNEIIGFRPGSSTVHRIHSHGAMLDTGIELTIDRELPLGRQHVILRDPLNCYSPAVQELCTHRGLFASHQIDDGSIGIMMMRLWQSEVGGVILRPGVANTPWDANPIIGISRALEFVFWDVDPETGTFTESSMNNPIQKSELAQREVLVMHTSRIRDIINRIVRPESLV